MKVMSRLLPLNSNLAMARPRRCRTTVLTGPRWQGEHVRRTAGPRVFIGKAAEVGLQPFAKDCAHDASGAPAAAEERDRRATSTARASVRGATADGLGAWCRPAISAHPRLAPAAPGLTRLIANSITERTSPA